MPLIKQNHLPLVRYSRIKQKDSSVSVDKKAVILGDTMGDLRKFYSLATVVFVGRSLVAMGGWIDTNTPPAKLGMFLHGDFQSPIDFAGASSIGTAPSFFGVINPSGFTRFDYRELEGVAEEHRYRYNLVPKH